MTNSSNLQDDIQANRICMPSCRMQLQKPLIDSGNTSKTQSEIHRKHGVKDSCITTSLPPQPGRGGDNTAVPPLPPSLVATVATSAAPKEYQPQAKTQTAYRYSS